MRRRALGSFGVLAGTLTAWLVLACVSAPGLPDATVNDVSQLNPIAVERVVRPRTIAEVQQLVAGHAGPISIGGARHSMGGQIGTEGALALDMRELNHVVHFDPEARLIEVEAGTTWRQIQQVIDPENLALRIMQSYANFTVGGSLSVNAHGRYVNQGPLINAVRSLEIVLADGSLVEASPEKNADVFFGAIGGYGGLGVIVTATLELVANEPLETHIARMPIAEYPAFFEREIRHSQSAVMHNGDFYPPKYDEVTSITFSRTEQPVTVKQRLQPENASYWKERLALFWLSELPFGPTLRERVIDPTRLHEGRVVWRNYEASYDVADVEPRSRKRSTYLLQEYFVPVAQFGAYAAKLGAILSSHDVNVINVSIRHASPDRGSLLAWAREECFAFVIFYKQDVDEKAREEVRSWTRELIDAALDAGGSYYLPYQIYATDEQFHRAYPRMPEFVALKRKLDPGYKFRNKLWDAYLAPSALAERAERDLAVHRQLAARPGYRREASQTFLTLPEWYIVFSADEQAARSLDSLPSDFPYFASIGQFWGRYRHSYGAARDTGPFNFGYNAMICVIGASYSVGYAASGAYENTLGRLTEWVSLGGDPARREADDLFMAQDTRDYAAFIHATPWYAYPFWTKLGDYWRVDRSASHWTARRVERKLASSVGLGMKAGWGKLIGLGTGAAYAPEDLEIQAWIRSRASDFGPDSGIRVLDSLGDDSELVSIARYEGFEQALGVLSERGIELVEVAGNRRILITLLTPRDWNQALLYGVPLDEWPLLTDPTRKRVALMIDVGQLTRAWPALHQPPIALDHVYDY
jgi:FAD/FMN-containing dehydrogenase